MSTSTPPNILWVILDDLRPQLARAYGQPSMASLTPAFDRLASEATTFTHAYAQQSICGPSRNSFLSGRRPDRIRTYTFESSFRDAPGGLEMRSLPQAFKEAGYVSCGVGKTFHDDAIMSPPDYDLPLSWSAECGDYYVAPRDGCPPGEIVCSVPGAEPGDYEDSLVVRHAAQLLDAFVAARRTFLLVVGLRRPHLPWVVPAEVIERVPRASEIAVARHPTAAAGAPPIAYFNCLNEGNMMRMMLPPGVDFNATTPLPPPLQAELRRGYYAAVAWADLKLGELLGALEGARLANDTIVLVHGDHGFHLGEHGSWCKESNAELATRVPLLLRDSRRRGAAAAGRGVRSHEIVELVDVYRTLSELAGVPVQPDVDGRSFARQLLRRHGKEAERRPPPREGRRTSYVSSAAAFSQYPRCRGPGVGGMVLCALGSSEAPDDTYVGWQLQPQRDSWAAVAGGKQPQETQETEEEEQREQRELHSWIDAMGLSVRVQGWRFTEWYPWDKATMAPAFNADPSRVARELYPHPHSGGGGDGDGGDNGDDLDATENENLADMPEHASVQRALQRRLLDHFVAMARAPPKRRETPRGRVVEVEEDEAPHGRAAPSVHHPQEQQQRRRRRLALDWEGRRLKQERHRRLEQRRERGRLMRRAAAARGAMLPGGG